MAVPKVKVVVARQKIIVRIKAAGVASIWRFTRGGDAGGHGD